MGIWKSLKRRVVSWHNLKEWMLVDVDLVHEVLNEYPEAVEVEVRYARVYKNVETGETRVKIGSRKHGFPTLSTGHPSDRGCSWSRIGSDKTRYTTTEKSVFIEENQTWEEDQ